MSTPSFNLQRLLELAEQQSAIAAATLGLLNQELGRAQEKLALLIGYRTEYQQRLRDSIAHGVDGAGLRNFQNFLERLEQAIAQQQKIVTASQARTVGGRQEWQSKQRKYMAFDTLSQRSQAALRRRDASREQKMFDELASRPRRGPDTHR
jgi:flagellar FliJ protein